MSAREYTHSRPRGYAEWNPRPETLAVLANVEAVLEEYAEHLPLTVRQVFYRLVGAHGYSKTERAYSRLSEYLVRARRAEIIGWDAIRDDGTKERRPHGYTDVEGFWGNVRSWARGYRRDRLDGQPTFIEIWVEAMGMVPQIEKVARVFGAPVFSSGGFGSVTAKHDAAERILERDASTLVLNVGDHDPSGLSIFDSAAEDVAAFVEAGGGWNGVTFQRVAVTEAQIAAHDLPTAPPKKADKRGNWTGGTVQCEALDPATLAGAVRDGIKAALDLGIYRDLLKEEAQERKELIQAVEEMTS